MKDNYNFETNISKPKPMDILLEDIHFILHRIEKNTNDQLLEISAAIGAILYKLDHILLKGVMLDGSHLEKDT